MAEPRRANYVVITSDCHAGAELRAYKPYLAFAFHEEFDSWAETYTDGWSELDKDPLDTHDENVRIGVASFMSPYNWDTAKRLEHLEGEGIAAEVVFPNTVPPFYPCSVIGAPGPLTAEDYRLRWAGVQAHNRWLVDFCAELPGRRAGLAQVFLDDVDHAVDEVRWAKHAGLSGVLIPHDHLKKLVPLYEPRLDPFWAVCTELDMPVHRHAIVVGDSEAAEGAAHGPAIGMLEAPFFAERGFGHLVLAGVLKRFPDLKFVFTETGNDWVPRALRKFDAWVREGGTEGSMLYPFAGNAVKELDLLPSEYFRRNCYVGASLMTKAFVDTRDLVGVDRIMWGGDYPHHEGTWPHGEVALRLNFSEVPEAEVRAMTSEVAASVYGFDLALLQGIADRIGPSVERIATKVIPDEVPRNTMNPTFVEAERMLIHAQASPSGPTS